MEYVLIFTPCDISLTFIRCLTGDLCNVALSFLGTTDIHALNLSPSDSKFKHLEKIFNEVHTTFAPNIPI